MSAVMNEWWESRALVWKDIAKGKLRTTVTFGTAPTTAAPVAAMGLLAPTLDDTKLMDWEEFVEQMKTYPYEADKEENVNYLFEVYVIDLKNQSLMGTVPVICSDAAKATAAAALELDVEVSRLPEVKFHVEKVCGVPAWGE